MIKLILHALYYMVLSPKLLLNVSEFTYRRKNLRRQQPSMYFTALSATDLVIILVTLITNSLRAVAYLPYVQINAVRKEKTLEY